MARVMKNKHLAALGVYFEALNYSVGIKKIECETLFTNWNPSVFSSGQLSDRDEQSKAVTTRIVN